MQTETDIIDSLTALGYVGPCLQNDVLTKALESGLRCAEFRSLIAWLTHELHVLRKTDEQVVSDGHEDVTEFAMELSALLKELSCPYKQLVMGPLSERYEKREALFLLFDYLITELMAIKMCMKLKPEKQTYIIANLETNTARALESLSRDLQLGKPPDNISPKSFFDKLNFKLEERLRQVQSAVVSEPLLNLAHPLTDAQWEALENIHNDLDNEYNLRRQVMLTRMEVTVQSFQWCDSLKLRENQIVERLEHKMKELEAFKYGGDATNIIALLAARADLAIIEKTSSANVRKNTGSKIQKHVIGSVPDRGGRANEHAPPPPEMPSWQQQRASGPPGGGGGHRGGGGDNQRGGRGRGGGGNWQQHQNQQQHQQQQYQPRQQFEQRRSDQNQQQYQQRPQYEQQRTDQNWISGSGRVQGTGWNPQGNNPYERDDQHNNSGGGGGYQRGRSNYHRGGRGGRR